jgi:hypothetical protein
MGESCAPELKLDKIGVVVDVDVDVRIELEVGEEVVLL